MKGMNYRAALSTILILAGCASTPPPVALPMGGAAVEPASAASYPTTPPEPGPAPDFDMPVFNERTLANGLRVIYVERNQLPLVQAVLMTRGGMEDDPADLPGLASFTAEMLDEGAGGRTTLELAEAVEQLGASLSTGVAWDAAQISLRVLRERLPEALRLMADVAFRPDFPENELARVRDQRLTSLARARDEPAAIAANAFASLIYGEEHPYGRLATQESVQRIDRDALADFHREFYRPSAATLVMVGDVDASTHALVEEVFGAWPAGTVAEAVAPEPPVIDATRIFLIDKPGAAQSEIRIGHPGVDRGTPDFFALQVFNTILGGSFTSRLNQNLRETHGYTYGAGSGFGMRRGAGPFQASAAVVTAMTDSSLVQFFYELNRIRNEAIPVEELERAKQYVALRLPQQLETSGQIAARVAELAIYGLPLDYYDDYVEKVMAVTAADVQRVAREYVRPDRAVVVVVGDRSVIEPGVQALSIAPVELRAVEEFVR